MESYLCPAGVWTIGYGNTSFLKSYPNPRNIIITQSKADELLQKDLLGFYQCVVSETKNCNLSPKQIAALTSLCFNVGVQAFKRSTLLKNIKDGERNQIEIQNLFLAWCHAGGKKIEGLVRRREKEAKLFCSN